MKYFGGFFLSHYKPKKLAGLGLKLWLSYLKEKKGRCVSVCFNHLCMGDETYQGPLLPKINLHMHQGTLLSAGPGFRGNTPGLFRKLMWGCASALGLSLDDGLWLRKHGVYFCPFPWLNMWPQSFNPSASVSSPALCFYLYRRYKGVKYCLIEKNKCFATAKYWFLWIAL